MARTVLAMLLAAMLGAAAFHLYYRALDITARCRWDHPLDRGARQACENGRAAGYSRGARHQLDDLVGSVDR